MSEQLRTPAHREVSAELEASAHERREHLNKLEAEGHKQEQRLRASTEQIREAVEHEAISGRELNRPEHHKDQQHTPHNVGRELRSLTFKRALVRLQKREVVTDRILSKFIHQGAVDAASEALSKTIARPSGMIGGGLFALLSTTLLLVTSRHYGFRYNYLVFFSTFVIGLGIGLAIEAAFRLLRRK
jgi:hypothetical protein